MNQKTPTYVRVETPDCTCDGCAFRKDDDSCCEKPNEIDCYNDATDQQYIYIVKGEQNALEGD